MKRTVEIKYKALKNHASIIYVNAILGTIVSNRINSVTRTSFVVDYVDEKITLMEEFQTYIKKNTCTEKQMKKILSDLIDNAEITNVKIKEED